MSEVLLDLLRASPRKRVALIDLRKAWLSVHPEQVQHPERDSLLLECLELLAERGHVALPSEGSFEKVGNPRMPKFVTVVGAEGVPERDWATVPWLPALWFWPQLTNSELRTALAINEWMIRRRSGFMAVPLRERALELFGDEKYLDLKVRNDALFGGRLPLREIGAFQVVPPLPHRKADAPGRPIVVVENHHTYWSLAEWNSTARRYATVVYGAGYAVSATSRALGDVLREVQGSSVLYFGDLDPAGVRIPLQLIDAGYASMEPDLALYELALFHGRRRSGVIRATDEMALVTRWLPSLAVTIASLWQDGNRIPQESVGTEVLHEHSRRLVGSSD